MRPWESPLDIASTAQTCAGRSPSSTWGWGLAKLQHLLWQPSGQHDASFCYFWNAVLQCACALTCQRGPGRLQLAGAHGSSSCICWVGREKAPKMVKETAHSCSEILLVTKHMHDTGPSASLLNSSRLLPPRRICYSRSTYFKYRCIMNQLDLHNDQAGRTFKRIMQWSSNSGATY